MATVRDILGILASALLLIGCQQSARNLSFSDDSFENRTLDDYEKIEVSKTLMPGVIKVLPEGHLLCLVSGDTGRRLMAKDLNTGAEHSVLTIGRGDGEVLAVRDVSVVGNDIFVSSIGEGKVVQLSWDGDSKSFSKPSSRMTNARFLRAVPLGQDKFISLASSRNERMIVLSEEGNAIDTVGVFPDILKDEDTWNNSIFQSLLAVSPNGKHVLTACQSFDVFDIYDSSFKTVKEFSGPEIYTPNIKKISTEIGTRYMLDPPKHTYTSVAVSDSRIYLGYVGAVLNSEADFDRAISTIYSFDWNGHPKIAYRLPFEIQAFDIDEKNDVIYCLATSEKDGYQVFRLSF